jgi:cytochrome c oxidase cbb3-type subunit II
MRVRPVRFLKQKFIEQNAILLLVLTLVTISIGGIVEIVPLFTIETTIERVKGVRPYSPLELAGRDIYVREGCYLCHSQQVRPFRDEVERYGHYSLAAESMYDHPFQWGSERTGPDLARVGGKYSNEWHVAHLANPRDVVPESIMPPYAFLAERPVDLDRIADHMRTNRVVGVPYSDAMIASAKADAVAQVDPAADTAALLQRYPGAVTGGFGGDPHRITERDALVAYLQMLGTLVKFRDLSAEDLRQ